MKRSFQYLAALSLGVVLFYSELSKDTINSICLFAVLLFGIPHGAVDHKIHATTSGDKNLFLYILKYLLIASGYVLWWLFDPTKALFIFIILSSYHFGQELLEDHGFSTSTLLQKMIWGCVILILPMLWSIGEINDYLSVVTDKDFYLEPVWKLSITSVLLVALLVDLIFRYREDPQKGNSLIGLLLFVGTIFILHFLLSFVQAFVLYFVFFHSLNAFRHQFQWLKKQNKNYSIKTFFIDLLAFSSLAIVGMIFLLWVLNPEGQSSLITYFFILVSLITLPHAITLDQFYKFKQSKRVSLTD